MTGSPNDGLVDANAVLRRFLWRKILTFAATPNQSGDSVLSLLETPLSCDELAGILGWHQGATARYLRALAANGAIRFHDDRFIRRSEPFTRHAEWEDHLMVWLDHGRAVDEHALFAYSEFRRIFFDGADCKPREVLHYYRRIVSRFVQIEALLKSLRTGRSSVDVALGVAVEQIFDLYSTAPDLLSDYARSFSAVGDRANGFFVERLPQTPGLAVLDIGGGTGEVAARIVRARPNVEAAVVYDLPEAALALTDERERAADSCGRRLEWVGGNLLRETGGGLDGLTEGRVFDIIVLGWILHDWSDVECVGILQRAARHLVPGGRIYVLEKPIDLANPGTGALVDFVMLLMANGHERTLEDYKGLFKQAGLQLLRHEICPVGRDMLVVTTVSQP